MLAVEVVAQDRAAVAQVGALRGRGSGPGSPDLLHPERHHLHVAARARPRHRVLAELALDVDHREHELRIEARAHRLVAHEREELRARSPRRRSAPRPVRVIARTQARVSRSCMSTVARSFTACASVARTLADSTSYCCAPARPRRERQRQRGREDACLSGAAASLPTGEPRTATCAAPPERHLRRGRVAPVLVLDHAFLEAALADHDAMRDADRAPGRRAARRGARRDRRGTPRRPRRAARA